MNARGGTLLDAFLAVAADSSTSSNNVVVCGQSSWTYEELHTVSSAMARQLKDRYGHIRPTVAVICENHPYTLALFIAVWKVGGIVAPLDHHAPPQLMQAMLQNVAPTYVSCMKDDLVNTRIAQELGVAVEFIEDDSHNIDTLTRQYLHYSPDDFNLSNDDIAGPEDIALYIYTSSASSIHNLKCVPLSHGSLVRNGNAQLSWFAHNIQDVALKHLRVLGWSPLSHAMSMCSDFGTHVLLTGGCYIFGLLPSTYRSGENLSVLGVAGQHQQNVASELLSSIINYSPDVFGGVPWILDGVITALTDSAGDPAYLKKAVEALRRMQYIIMAGSATSETSIQWAKEHDLILIISIGMTETRGPLFNSLAYESSRGWDIRQCCIPDLEFALHDENGTISAIEGELYITSKNLPKGYHNLQTHSFTTDPATSLITFRTGDIYCHPESDANFLVWKGRKDDFIQVKSGESLDPRDIEKALNACPTVSQACITGNNFISGPADFICALIQLTPIGRQNMRQSEAQVSKVLASANRTLVPPLRIAWSRVLFLDADQTIPFTRKRVIFRKKLEELFSGPLSAHLASTHSHTLSKPFTTKPDVSHKQQGNSAFSKDRVWRTIVSVVSRAVGITEELLRDNPESTFAEVGMDSTMAAVIVNELNEKLSLSLSPNTCHVHIDLPALTNFICGILNGKFEPSSAKPSFRIKQSSTVGPEPIAIVGYALRLPGDINDSHALWNALVEKRKDILTSTPADRWDHASFQSQGPSQITFDKSGFIDLAYFDNLFFGIPAAEALSISPTTRLTLETAFEALERANIPLSEVKGTDMGVFVAAGLDPGYGELLSRDKGWEAFNRFYGTGNATSSACGRLSYLLDVHGPSITVETACSGSFVALDQAVRHLQSGRGDSAIVCGVNTHTLPGMFGFVSAQKMTSTKSRCATFSNQADGYAASEGVISLIVKTENAALRNGDKILGLIKATDTMHNGRTQGLIAPSSQAQAKLQRSLLRLSNLEPSDIDLIESHGTGTSLGDLIEIEAINDVFRGSHDPSRPLLLGAGKSTIGHTETVSGLLGLVSTLLAFEKGAVPGVNHLHEANLNPSIDCTLIPMHIPCDTVKLRRGSSMDPYRGMVLSYGFAGTISGVVVESPPVSQPSHDQNSMDASHPMLFVVSAKSQMGLLAYIHSYLSFCSKAPPKSFQSICYTSCTRREHYAHRFATVATNMEELITKLRNRLAQGLKSSAPPNPRIVFGFPGQGSQFKGMAKALADRFSGFRDIVVEYASEGEYSSGYPLLELMLGMNECDVDIDNSQIAQICIFVYQCAMAKWLTGLGIKADAVFGHSLGELAAAVVSGAFELSDALELVIARAGFLRSSESCPGAMVAVVAPAEVINDMIHALGIHNKVEIAVYNGKNSHVVSGAKDAIVALYTHMKAAGVRCSVLKVDQGFHSPSIEGGLPALQSWFDDHGTIFKPLQLPYYSTYLGERISPNQYLWEGYWLKHARNPVKLSAAASCVRNESSLSVFLDMGPQPTLMTAMQNDGRTGKPLLASTTCKAGNNQESALLGCLAQLFENRVALDLDQLYLQYRETFSKVSLPTYPYQRQRYYPQLIMSRETSNVPQYQANPPSQLFSVDQPLIDLLDEHRIAGRKVLPGAAFADFLARFRSNTARSVSAVRFHQPLVLEQIGKQVQLSQESDGSFTVFQNGSNEAANKLCSGTFASGPVAYTRRTVKTDEAPTRSLTHEDIYRPFEGKVYFGLSFRNVEKIYIFSDHIDAYVRVDPSHNPGLNRIRQLDPCLHLLGALVPLLNISEKKVEGVYLPAALEGFTLHTEDLPSSFICRYFLPIDTDTNVNTISLSLEVFSPSGELLVSCRKYLVAWLPKGVAIQALPSVPTPQRWLRSTWKPESLPLRNSPVPISGSDMVIYVGDKLNPNLLAPFVVQDQEVLFLDICKEQLQVQNVRSKMPPTTIPLDSLPKFLHRKHVSIVLDASRALDPLSGDFTRFWKDVLAFMKITVNGVLISNFVVVSHNSMPMDTTISQTSLPSAGSIVQGLLRVYRRELGLRRSNVWGLDLPSDLTPTEILDVVTSELACRQDDKNGSHSVVAYRRTLNTEVNSLVRLVPVLSPAAPNEATPDSPPGGVAVIVGTGAIGTAIGASLLRGGSDAVIFIGRRSATDAAIVDVLKGVRVELNATSAVEYIQTDATDLPALRNAFNDIGKRFSAIDHVIYTAGVVRDARINVLKEEDFQRVLHSKVTGAWNTHLICQEMELSLKSFALLSSISVPLGNPGQAAYVAANSFLDGLAAYRQSLGLRGTSLQLGAWQSHLTNDLNLSGSGLATMSHEIGIPLILRAIKTRDPVHVIAELDIPALQQNPVTGSDPLFLEVYANFAKSAPAVEDAPRAGPLSKSVARQKVIDIVKELLMLKPDDELELGQSLSSFGVDSIAFAQIRGGVLNVLNLELPIIYLSDHYSVDDMLNALCKDLSD